MKSLSEALLDTFHSQTPIRTGSLIVSIFGDAIVPRGGALSLSSLLEITRAFRIADGLVRTALSRLVSDGWFERWKLGRNSFYRLTSTGSTAFAVATPRIYGGASKPWSGAFDLLILEGPDERGAMRAKLGESGYGMAGQGLFIATEAAAPADGRLLRFSALPADLVTARRLVARAWPLAETAARYQNFLEVYRGAPEQLGRGGRPEVLDALVMRVLVIHDFRRAVLRDPLLPTELLPPDWPGTQARALCAAIYREVVSPSETWLDACGQDDRGPLPPPSAEFARRFRSQPAAA